MLRSVKIRLLPTPEQEALFWESAGVARWAYNYFLSENEKVYQEYISSGNQGRRYISGGDLRKHINNDLKPTTHKWLKRVSSNVMKQTVIDAESRYWYSSVGYPVEMKQEELTDKTVGVYLSMDNLAVCSDGKVFGNINHSQRVRKLDKRLKRQQHRLSAKLE